MKGGKLAALIIAVLGIIVSILMMFTDSPDSGLLTAYVWFFVLALLFVSGLFLMYKVTDILKHPAHKKEMLTLLSVIGVAGVLGVIMAFVTGGTTPVKLGNGQEFSDGSTLIMIGTFIWTTIIMLIMCAVLWIKNSFAKTS